MSGVDLYRFGDLDAWKEDEQDSMNNDKSGKVEYNDKVSQNSDDPLADLAAFSAELGGKMGFWDSHGSKWIDNFGQREGEVCDAEEKWLQDLVDELDVKIEGLDLDHELKKWESWGSLAKFFVPYWHQMIIEKLSKLKSSMEELLYDEEFSYACQRKLLSLNVADTDSLIIRMKYSDQVALNKLIVGIKDDLRKIESRLRAVATEIPELSPDDKVIGNVQKVKAAAYTHQLILRSLENLINSFSAWNSKQLVC